VRSQQITIATGAGAVAVSGSADRAVIITGNRNVVITGADAEAIRQVLDDFQLKDFPNPQKDWARLLEQSRENLVSVPDQIGNTVFLLRQVELEAIETAFETSKVVVLLGTSGCGKTVIAKSWAEKELSSSQVIWWNARSLDVSDFQSFQSRLGLSHPLRELLATAPAPRAYVVIDGLERIFSEFAFQNLSVLIQALQLNFETSPWRILIPCQLEEWNRVQLQLARANNSTAKWRIVQVKEPSIDDLTPVWKTFPALGRLRYQPQLQSLLLKPKVLDLLATKLSLGGSVDTTRWVGESNLIEWFWETEVCKQPNARVRAGFLKTLGEKQADDLESETPTDSFNDLAQVDSLISDRFCQEREERLSFYHDLYGDWARQRVLLGKANNLCEYLEPRISSPLWHRAVRLYGLHLLEKNEDTTQWRSAFVALENASQLTQDLLLEAAIFAADPLPLLERLWSDLAANEGLLLRRLLGRFLHVATLPNPMIREILGLDSEARAATIDRIPYWPYWLPMLRFLHKHLEDVIELAPKQVAEIADAWLWRGGRNAPLRRETAELVLTQADQILHNKQEKWIGATDKNLSEIVYHAALAGIYELPDRVAALALKASARRESSSQISQSSDSAEYLPKRVVIDYRPLFEPYEVELPPPWPDGPCQRVDSEFQKTCLETATLYPLILSNPSLAREILLALLIKEPVALDCFRSHSFIDDKLETAKVQAWDYKPPFYNRGPFLFFLQSQPREGLETILRLVNFATERWAARKQEDNQTLPEVQINLPSRECRWIGDYTVYYWFRNHHSCPKPVVIALMALEKWLYDEIDSNREIEQVVEFILQQSHSIAFAGLLNTLGSKEPKLFWKSLKPFLGVPEFHRWELLHRHDLDVGSWNVDSDWWGEGEESIKRAREWHSLSHREQGLDFWANILFLNEPEFRSFFNEVRSNWIAKLQTVQDLNEPTNLSEELKTRYEVSKEFLERLIAEYEIGNYSLENHPNHGEVWRFNPPENLIARREEYSKANDAKQLLLLFPVQCFQILDKGQPLPENALPEFWDILQKISKLLPPPDPDSTHNKIEDAVCGGAAVLLKLHRNWLQQNPDKEEWCITQIVKTIFNPQQPRGFDLPDSLISWNWEAFCASIIPVLWAESPDSPILRQCVIRLALAYHYETVKILFSSAANYRSTLGGSFKQLQHFILRWAAIRWKRDYSLSEDDPNFNIEVWVQQEAEAFIQKTTASTMLLLEEVAIQETPRVSTTDTSFSRSKEKHSPGIDLSLIQSAYAWIPALEAATSKVERAEWLAFWKSALGCTLRMYGVETEDEEKFKIEPFWKWDEWIIEHIIPLILQLHITENSKEFWQPILNLGRRASFLVERFLNEWFRHGLKSEPASERFIREWRAMIVFVFSSPHWSRNSFYLEEAWCNLMGFSEFVYDMWNEAQKPTVRRMHDLYECWAHQHLIEPRCAVKFIIFLKQPAAEGC
jgi:hypothetical protein